MTAASFGGGYLDASRASAAGGRRPLAAGSAFTATVTSNDPTNVDAAPSLGRSWASEEGCRRWRRRVDARRAPVAVSRVSVDATSQSWQRDYRLQHHAAVQLEHAKSGTDDDARLPAEAHLAPGAPAAQADSTGSLDALQRLQQITAADWQRSLRARKINAQAQHTSNLSYACRYRTPKLKTTALIAADGSEHALPLEFGPSSSTNDTVKCRQIESTSTARPVAGPHERRRRTGQTDATKSFRSMFAEKTAQHTLPLSASCAVTTWDSNMSKTQPARSGVIDSVSRPRQVDDTDREQPRPHTFTTSEAYTDSQDYRLSDFNLNVMDYEGDRRVGFTVATNTTVTLAGDATVHSSDRAQTLFTQQSVVDLDDPRNGALVCTSIKPTHFVPSSTLKSRTASSVAARLPAVLTQRNSPVTARSVLASTPTDNLAAAEAANKLAASRSRRRVLTGDDGSGGERKPKRRPCLLVVRTTAVRPTDEGSFGCTHARTHRGAPISEEAYLLGQDSAVDGELASVVSSSSAPATGQLQLPLLRPSAEPVTGQHQHYDAPPLALLPPPLLAKHSQLSPFIEVFRSPSCSLKQTLSPLSVPTHRCYSPYATSFSTSSACSLTEAASAAAVTATRAKTDSRILRALTDSFRQICSRTLEQNESTKLSLAWHFNNQNKPVFGAAASYCVAGGNSSGIDSCSAGDSSSRGGNRDNKSLSENSDFNNNSSLSSRNCDGRSLSCQSDAAPIAGRRATIATVAAQVSGWQSDARAARASPAPGLRCRHQGLKFVEKLLRSTCIISSLLLFFAASSLPSPGAAFECDRMFISTPEGARNGTFSAPHMDVAGAGGSIQVAPANGIGPIIGGGGLSGGGGTARARQCIYTFIAQPGERVDVTFTTFRIRGSPPECNHEYIDIYSEVQDPSAELINSPFGGRFCGRIYPRRRISVYRTLVISFYTDFPNDTANVFRGTYEFINASRFIVGTPVSPSAICSFNIYGTQKREGDFYSPTYPGVYPGNLDCQYRFIGTKGQRIRLEFMDFDLSFGGTHCPFDTVKVYDGPDDGPSSPLIGTYCGQQRSLEVYSSAEALFVRFRTLRRQADSQNRGFAGWFEFSEKFAKLDFISEDGEHIRGTECDQKILSRKESSGTVYSPNWPLLYTASVVCKYFIYGLEDAQHLERVSLAFEKVDINASDSECTDAFLKVYLQGQEERGEMESFDHAFCGDTVPPPLRSDGPRLMLVFSSANTQGQGFKATYTFETDYKIPGTPSPSKGCYFTYVSEGQQTGEFNSPRYPANYPSMTTCEYHFLGKSDEQVKIVFGYFRTRSDSSATQYNDGCEEDWLELYETNEKTGLEKKYGRYCSGAAPGPIVTDLGYHSVRVLLHTDDQGVARGFYANYYFLKNVNRYGDCGRNISNLEGGIVTSPGFPNPYKNARQLCNWWITVKPNRRIHFFFTLFHVEGEPTDRGCPSAVVRLWPDPDGVGPPVELCGETLTDGTREILSVGNILKVQFVTAAKAVGNQGFKAIWTEIREDDNTCTPTTKGALAAAEVGATTGSVPGKIPARVAGGFRCANGRCISARLVCNGLPNCGPGDETDEINCKRSSSIDELLVVVAASIFATCCALLMLCVGCSRRRRRYRNRRRRMSLVFPPNDDDDDALQPPHLQPPLQGMHYAVQCVDDV